MSDDKVEGAKAKVKRLLNATVIRKVAYPEWLDNTVMVKKNQMENGECALISQTFTRLV